MSLSSAAPSPSPELPPDHAPLRGRRACVTGGAGFIGSHLVEALVAAGAEVSVIDDLSNGREENLDGVRPAVRFVAASVLDRAALDEALRGAEIVFHQAALGSVPASVERPAEYVEVNAAGTLAVLEACRRAGTHRLVYAASSSAYGDQQQSPKVESMAPDPLSPYAASKLAGEHLVRAFASCYGLEAISLRYFNVFGARQRADSPYAAVIPRFIDALRSGRRPLVHGDGGQTRDFVHVSDVVRANLLAATAPRPLAGETVNVASGAAVSVRELLTLIAGILGVAPQIEFAPARAGDVMHSVASIDAAARLIGYRPRMSLEEGLRELVAASGVGGRASA